MLKVRNDSGRPRRLSATGYVEWVLGDLRPKSSMHVITEIDPASGALLARNAYNSEFADRVAFFDVDEPTRTVTGDRTEFLGRNGTLANPAAHDAARAFPAGSAPALDPCAAMQVPFELADGQEREIIFRLGVGTRGADDAAQADTALPRDRRPRAARSKRSGSTGTAPSAPCTSKRPTRRRTSCANGWLLYQTLACRLWARSGYYQSGGAFGFRDQLQDAMALSMPSRACCASTCCAARPASSAKATSSTGGIRPSGRGVRTHFSDDYLWLPLATCRYVLGTGDTGVLDETSRTSSKAAPVNPEEDSYYDLPARSDESATLYEHCVRAIVQGPAVRRARPAADGLRRLERRHEPGRPQGQGRKRLAGLLPLPRARRSSPRSPARGATRPSPTAAWPKPPKLRAEHRAARRGTASGTAAPTSTTARRSARPPTPNARSTRSRRAGRCCPAPATPSASRMAMDALDRPSRAPRTRR